MVKNLSEKTKKIYSEENEKARKTESLCVTMCEVLIENGIDHMKYEKIIRYIGKIRNVPTCTDMFNDYQEFCDMFQDLIESLENVKASAEAQELFYMAGEMILQDRFPKELAKLQEDDDEDLYDPELSKFDEIEKLRETNEGGVVEDYEENEPTTLFDLDDIEPSIKKSKKSKQKSELERYLDEEDFEEVTKENLYNFKSKNNTKLVNREGYNMYNNNKDQFDEIISEISPNGQDKREANLTNSFVKSCKKGDKFKKIKKTTFKKKSKAYKEFRFIMADIFNVESPMFNAFEENPDLFINKTLFEIYCDMFSLASNPAVKELKESKLKKCNQEEMCVPDENDTRPGLVAVLEGMNNSEKSSEEVKPNNFGGEDEAMSTEKIESPSNVIEEQNEKVSTNFNDVAKEIIEKYGKAEDIEKETASSDFIRNFASEEEIINEVVDNGEEPVTESVKEEINNEPVQAVIEEEYKSTTEDTKTSQTEKAVNEESRKIEEEKKEIKNTKEKKNTKKHEFNFADSAKMKLRGFAVFNKVVWGL